MDARALFLQLLAAALIQGASAAECYKDRFVWVFGWGLGRESDVSAIKQVLEKAGRQGFNGAVVSLGLDTLCKKSPDELRRLEEIRQACAAHRLELIPSVFSIGYGGGLLSHDRYLAEGLPVTDAPFVVRGQEGHFVPDDTVRFANGGFEEFTGQRLAGYGFHDQPGEVSFVDREVRHSAEASLRLENFTSNPHGHGRVMQEVPVRPRRCYRVSVWVRTDGLQPVSSFRCIALAGNRELAPRSFNLPATSDWRKISFIFNSLEFDKVRLYAGLWEGRAGKVWLDDWSIEDVGPVNVLRRPGTPVTVRSEDGENTYEEGRDYAPLTCTDFSAWRGDSTAAVLKVLPDGRIKDGQRLQVSWYHSMLIHDSQVTVCMAEPALDEIFDHEAKLLAERLQPRRVLLNMDEVRMGGTCRACQGRDMAQLLGECVAKQAEAIRRHSPGARVYVWSDMFDPNHNARGDYYLVNGNFAGSWKHIPKDLVIGVWGGAPRSKSLRFFADEGFSTLVACYYDAANLDTVRGWLEAARSTPGVKGFMYTTWERRYELLPEFGELLGQPR